MQNKVILILICFQIGKVVSDSVFKDVNTTQGVVRGYNSEHDKVFSFYGIPYATAPHGADLFKESLPPPKWTNVFNATNKYTVCPQKQTTADQFIPLQRSIDCLNVNVFVPTTIEHELPVLFFIHGGAFTNGYGSQISPTALVKRGLVVVTFNYRLGVHGFLCLGTEFAPGNAGLKDQARALKWVRENIKNFGGDPNKITIAGSSAGSGSVELHMLSNTTNKMFSQAICNSGSTIGYSATTRDPLTLAEALANFFGVYADRNTVILESFFSLMTEDQLSAEYPVGFLPCIENHNLTHVEKFLEDYPLNIIKNNLQSKVPLLTGFTTTEGLVVLDSYETQSKGMAENFADYLPKDLNYNNQTELNNIAEKVKNFYFPSGQITEDGFIYYFTDTMFNYPQYMFARYHSRVVSSVFLHLFTFNGTVKLADALPTDEGVGHTAETLYVFDLDVPWVYENMTSEDYLVQDHIRDFYFNFCHVGNPSTSLTWDRFSEKHPYYMEISATPTMREYPARDAFNLWDSIYHYHPENVSNSVVFTGNFFMQVLSVIIVCMYL